MFAILGDAVNAYNNISWADSVPFIICLVGLYWGKKWIDLRFARKQSKIVYSVKIVFVIVSSQLELWKRRFSLENQYIK